MSCEFTRSILRYGNRFAIKCGIQRCGIRRCGIQRCGILGCGIPGYGDLGVASRGYGIPSKIQKGMTNRRNFRNIPTFTGLASTLITAQTSIRNVAAICFTLHKGRDLAEEPPNFGKLYGGFVVFEIHVYGLLARGVIFPDHP